MFETPKNPTLFLKSILLGLTLFLASTSVVQAKIDISPTTVQVGQKFTLTNSDSFAPMSGSEKCTDGQGDTHPDCAFTTQVWFWRNNYRYRQAPILSSTANQIVVTVPNMPADGDYRVAVEHDYTGRGFNSYVFGLGFDNKVKILNPPSPKPTPSPSPLPTPSPTPVASETPVAVVSSKTDEDIDDSLPKNSGDETKQDQEKRQPQPSSVWEKILFPIRQWLAKLFRRE